MKKIQELKKKLKENRIIRCRSCCKKKDKREFSCSGREYEICMECMELENY